MPFAQKHYLFLEHANLEHMKQLDFIFQPLK